MWLAWRERATSLGEGSRHNEGYAEDRQSEATTVSFHDDSLIVLLPRGDDHGPMPRLCSRTARRPLPLPSRCDGEGGLPPADLPLWLPAEGLLARFPPPLRASHTVHTGPHAAAAPLEPGHSTARRRMRPWARRGHRRRACPPTPSYENMNMSVDAAATSADVAATAHRPRTPGPVASDEAALTAQAKFFYFS